MQSLVTAAADWSPRSDRKAYIVWMGIVWVAVLAGFGLDLTRYFGEAPPPPAILHIHGVAYAAWMILVTVQIFLVETGDIRLHKTLGWWTAGLSAAMVPLGVIAAMVDMARQVNHPDYAPQFLGLEFVDMVGFAVFMATGIQWRKDPAAHKRLMVLSAMALVDAGFSRAWQLTVKASPPGPFGWWFQYFWGTTLMLLAMAGWDLWRRKRIHWTVALGMAVLWGGELVSVLLQFSPAWKTAMVALVKAWAWTG